MQMLLDRVDAPPRLRVGDLVHGTPIRIYPDATAREAAAKLAYYDITSAPVVERNGRLLGVVSASDILQLGSSPVGQARFDGATPALDADEVNRRTVREFMMPALLTVEPESTLTDVVELMRSTGAERVLVVGDGDLCGIVTTTAVLQALLLP